MMKRQRLLMITATLAMTAMTVACSDHDDAPAVQLSVTPENIPATVAAGSYSIAVTSNAAWTATADSAATWCTVNGSGGNGNGTITVNVDENLTIDERAATVAVTAGALTRTVAVTQAAAALVLEVDTTTINATASAATYTIAVTSNAAWTATAKWCALAGDSATGDGTITVDVAENPTIATRADTVTIVAGALTRTVAVMQQGVPFYAASGRTWTFGGSALAWSDAIRVPACAGEDFVENMTVPLCRAYTEGANTWYYYNWAYVNQHAATLCPPPWRVPTAEEFQILTASTSFSALIDAWGYGGFINGGSVDSANEAANYWASTEYDGERSHCLYYNNSYAYSQGISNNYRGLQVRCVK
jgi:hypothetical protein